MRGDCGQRVQTVAVLQILIGVVKHGIASRQAVQLVEERLVERQQLFTCARRVGLVMPCILRVDVAEYGGDVQCHGDGIGRGQPDMWIDRSIRMRRAGVKVVVVQMPRWQQRESRCGDQGHASGPHARRENTFERAFEFRADPEDHVGIVQQACIRWSQGERMRRLLVSNQEPGIGHVAHDIGDQRMQGQDAYHHARCCSHRRTERDAYQKQEMEAAWHAMGWATSVAWGWQCYTITL